MPAGYSAPLHLTVRQEQYCRRAIGITRFIYNLCVATHRFYPSSKTCSVCGVVNAKLKRERHWRCGHCGTTHERNLNAAVNLRNLLTLLSGRGVTLRNGKALAAGRICCETGPDDRRTATSKYVSDTADCVLSDREILNANTP
jgi:ribosomal protein S27AE